MKNVLASLALLPLLTALPAPAQTTQPVEDFKPSSLNQPGKQYPQVNSERQVRVRVVAPQAQSVVLDFLGGAKYPLSKGDDGAWVGVTRPQDEGFHYYQIVVDGRRSRTPAASTSTAAAAGAAGLKSLPRIRSFTRKRTSPMGNCGRHCTSRRAPAPFCAALSTLRRTTKTTLPGAIRCCICSMAAAKTKPDGAARGMLA